MTKLYLKEEELHKKILAGVNVLADAVSSTLGPRGRNVILQSKKRKPIITKDGVTCAKFVDLEDPFENAAAQIIKQAAEATVANAGDGTTTATVLARDIIKNVQPHLVRSSVTEIKKGMDLAVDVIVKKLHELSEPVENADMVAQIATISANGDKGIGVMISKAVDTVGKDGSITIKQSPTEETKLDVSEGFTIQSGLYSKALVTDERRGVARYEDCNVLVTDQNIKSIDELLPSLSLAARDDKPFIIVAPDIKEQPLAAIIMNKLKGSMDVTAVKAPGYGEERKDILSDLAATLGARFISEDEGEKLKDVELKDFGNCELFVGGRNTSTFVGGESNDVAIADRMAFLKDEIANEENLKKAQKLQERLTRLASGVAVIYVGGSTEIEVIEKTHRVEDALEAVNSARQEGVVPGGGTALLHTSKKFIDEGFDTENEDQAIGVELIVKACEAPLRQMLENAGGKVETILEKVKEKPFGNGYDVSKEKFTDLGRDGILDPVKVVRCALQNAVSAAGTLLTTNVAIIEIESKTD